MGNFTQKEFAQQIGVSLVIIKKIESGEREITPEISRRIFAITGASESSIMKGDGKVFFLAGKDHKYEEKHYRIGRIFTVTKLGHCEPLKRLSVRI